MSFDLDRFVAAQDSCGTYDGALAELSRGRKVGHWMWFVFPQLTGLGRSGMSQRYALPDVGKAADYLVHPVLGPRLVEASRAVLESGAPDVDDLFGGIDTAKLRSSMTLFELAGQNLAREGAGKPEWAIFGEILDRYFAGARDDRTLSLLHMV